MLRIREQMMALQRRMFAASSEKRPRDQDAAPSVLGRTRLANEGKTRPAED
ncbi:MAG: hypothetical protein JWN04_712, partial [Myxococcaceae bacterium]|nr:hypothetical protein [Myxococcaceae bacterium]